MSKEEPTADHLYKLVEPHYRTIVDRWTEVQRHFGSQDALLVIDMDRAERGDPLAVLAYPRATIVEVSSIDHPSAPEGKSLRLSPEVIKRIAQPPSQAEGFACAFWVVAFRLGNQGICGCLRLNVNFQKARKSGRR